ncbi:hypothetical protein [Conexivisphaera calida]|nr:hypothetical protein [Conexivisphaera calida]
MSTMRGRRRSVPGWTVDCDYDAVLNVLAYAGRGHPSCLRGSASTVPPE